MASNPFDQFDASGSNPFDQFDSAPVATAKPSRDWSWRDAYRELYKIPAQGAMGVLNTGVKAAKGIAGLGSLGKNLLQGKGLDASLAAATDTIGNRNVIADMGPQSKIMSALGENVIAPAVNKTASALSLSPETIASVLEAGGDIATIAGLGGIPKSSMLKTASSPVMAAKQNGIVRPVMSTAGVVKDQLMNLTLKQPNKMSRAERNANIVTALENGYRPTAKGVTKLNDDIAALEATLGDNFTAAQAQGVAGSPQKAIDYIDALRREAQVSSQPTANLAMIDDAIANLQNHPLASNGQVGIGDLQAMKVAQGREIQKSYGEMKPQFQNLIDKARVRGFKDEIIDVMSQNGFDTLSDVNSQLSKLYQLKKVLDPASNRMENSSQLGGLGYKAGVGGMLGTSMGMDAGTGASVGAAIGLAQNPYIAPHVAGVLHRLSQNKPSPITIDNKLLRSGLLSGGLVTNSLRDTQ